MDVVEDVATVLCQIVDAAGVPCLDAKDFYHFSISGDGRLVDNQGCARASRKVGACNGRAQISIELNDGVSALGISVPGLPTQLQNLSAQ